MNAEVEAIAANGAASARSTALEKLALGRATTEGALAILDALEPVSTSFMLGHWKGEGFHTKHPLDGVLEAYHWYGKRFDSEEEVHPLVFESLGGGRTHVNPKYMGPLLGLLSRVRVPTYPIVGRMFQLAMPLFFTRKSAARLRMTEYRGKTSATMIYDRLPINDVFRRIDDNRVFGVMDLKVISQPFFFILRREA